MLTKRQLQLLTFICEYSSNHGVTPSFEEMRSALRLKSKSGVHRLISALEERGYIQRIAYKARALEILKNPPETLKTIPDPDSLSEITERTVAFPASSNVVEGQFDQHAKTGTIQNGIRHIPLYGSIAAGSPIEAINEGQTIIEVPAMMTGRGDHYVLKVSGDSMIDAGIFDGDLVVIQRCSDAANGDIVVALIEDKEVTLKRLRRKGGSVALEPANSVYETRIFGPNQVVVQGKLVGLMRSY